MFRRSALAHGDVAFRLRRYALPGQLSYVLSQVMSELPNGFVSASHAILFAADDDRCSVCCAPLGDEDDDETTNEGQTLTRGRGLLVWARGEERRYEEPELCGGCASAIGVTALHRWEIEEDEG
jgi:hypothetical protein